MKAKGPRRRVKSGSIKETTKGKTSRNDMAVERKATSKEIRRTRRSQVPRRNDLIATSQVTNNLTVRRSTLIRCASGSKEKARN